MGGGIAGISSAYHLAKQNVKSTLVEQDKLAFTTSGRSVGVLSDTEESYGDITPEEYSELFQERFKSYYQRRYFKRGSVCLNEANNSIKKKGDAKWQNRQLKI